MRNYRFSVKLRLVLSFGAIAFFTILAGAIGIVVFANSWATIEDITRSHLPTLTTAHQLAQQSKALAATAPMLRSATVQSQRLTASNRIADQTAWLEKLIDTLRVAGVGSLGAIERERDRLLQSFKSLDELVEAKIGARIEKETAVSELLASHRAFRAALAQGIGDDRAGSEQPPGKVEVLGAAVANSLRAAANAARPENLKRIEEEYQQTARQWEKSISAVRGGVGADVLEHSRKMVWFGTRPDNIFRLRERELNAAAAAERILYVYNRNASRLVFAAAAVIESVQADITSATRESRADLIFHGVFLIIIAVACISGAILLSLYVSRNIGGRLAALQESMEVHASGGACDIPSGGDDEITRMSGALQTFITTINQREAELRQSEARLANAQRIAGVGDWEWNLTTGRVRRSAELCRLLGITPKEPDTSHERFIERVHRDDREAVDRVLEAIIEKGEPFSLNFRIVLPDGAVRVLHEQGEVAFNGSDQPVVLAGTTQDITERKRAEETLLASEHALQERVADLEEAQRKLERQGEDLVQFASDLEAARDQADAANRAKSEFLAAMSHELRTPLNAIIGFSEIIKDETFGPVGNLKYREYTNDIHSSGEHLLELINDILDLSKIESGKDELHEETIEVRRLARSVGTLVRGRAQAQGVALDFDMAEGLPKLWADKRKLKQILVNLLSNAIKFTNAGGRVVLKIWCHLDSGYVFQVIDTGIGIAIKDIPMALAPFQQIEGGLNRTHEGTGLGLPLTKAVVEMHGGTLDVQSEVGVGTTVTVRFPEARSVRSPRDTGRGFRRPASGG